MPNIRLRPQRVSDAKRFFEILRNPNFRYFTAIVNTLDDELKFLKQNANWRREHFAYNFTILVKNAIVGGCGIRINQHRKYCGEIGYFIDEKYWGKGIATKAVRLLGKIGFDKLKLKRIEILMDVRNKPSEKVAIKSGYRKEGIMRKALKQRFSNEFFDCYLYAKVKI